MNTKTALLAYGIMFVILTLLAPLVQLAGLGIVGNISLGLVMGFYGYAPIYNWVDRFINK